MILWLKRISILSFVLISLFCMAGCNTIAGAGQDIEEAGEALEEGADADQESESYEIDG